MNLFGKIKSFVKSKLSKPKPKEEINNESEEPEDIKLDANEEIARFVIDKLNEQILNPKELPPGLTDKQWRTILGNIIFSWDQSYRNIELASPRKKKIQKIRILLGFKLFIKYFKFIK